MMRRGFSLLEMVLVIAIITLLLGILLPTLTAVREHARQDVCQSNVHQLALAINMYAGDYDETLPPQQVGRPAQAFWYNLVVPAYVKSFGVLKCPSDPDKDKRVTSYGSPWPHLGYRYPMPGENPARVPGNQAAFHLAWFTSASHAAWLIDSDDFDPRMFINQEYVYCPINDGTHVAGPANPGSTPFCNVTNRHTGGSNIAFLDGHARFLQRSLLIDQSRAAGIIFSHFND